eukprot:CAMPEP_0174923832 /NCGR_PEP_ID=MMETSP1355-20121228/6848_1 /TAXON_ID=464990 /ORGANISM="Hemiselmis tepida, Strain CCMP443" /LENGTH=373 /DNA_ID=CAMNT_0016169567 /DNA_START=147 /DNA_END=1265 /DNA_ORIENTATION=+
MGSRAKIDLGLLGEWSNILAYRTNKAVLVRDKVLGPAYLVTSVMIVFYIVYRIVFEKAYLDYEAVSGSVKLVLTGFSPGINMMREDYCRDMTCRLCDEHDVRYPNFDTREVLVTTYVREARQHRVCQRNATECPFKSPYQTVAWDDYLVAGIQHFSINVEHSVQAPTFFFLTQNKRYRGSSRNMRGRLVSHKKGAVKVLKEFPANGEVDTVSIQEVLEAAGLDLDHVLPGHVRPIRMTGTIIECHIHYFNDYSFFAPANRIRYEYEFFAGGRTVESIDEPVHLGVAWRQPVDFEERMLLTRSGLKLVWTQDGALGKFSFSVLLLTLATGAVLLGVVRCVGDFAALNLMPKSHIYSEALLEDADGIGETKMVCL